MAKSVAVFNWIDKEIELLLETIKSFKAENDAEGIDYCRTKYEKIMNILLEIYPKKIRMMKKMIPEQRAWNF